MKTQTQINKEWEVAYTLLPSGNRIGLLQPPIRKGKLKSPYQYQIPVASFRRLVEHLKEFISTFSPLAFQHTMVDTKPVKYGSRLEIWALGYMKSYTGDESGLDKNTWDHFTQTIKEKLIDILGPDVPLYIEPWTPERKFQMKFYTYIMFTELAPMEHPKQIKQAPSLCL